MPEYQWAVRKGQIITADYNRSMALTADDVENEIRSALNNCFEDVHFAPVSDEYKEVYLAEIQNCDVNERYYITAKGTTPGGRSNLKNEQRIQQKAKYLNYAYQQKQYGTAVCIGVYKYESDVIFCAWNLNKSSADLETPISKQIKISTIARAMSEGFVQQESSSGDFVCAFRKEMLYFYLINSSWLHKATIQNLNSKNERIETQADVQEENEIIGSNELFYGVPGAGKSHKIDEIIKESSYERVVFHPDYTYSDFVGQIMPKLKKDKDGNEKLSYEFIPGPFIKALNAAEADPNHMFYLVIEEINRGNAPAIFGDIFQLLDRNPDGSGKYFITNYDIAREVYGDENHMVRIPENLTILATMNTSDQNVFTLDTAFQRRWNMKYIINDINGAGHANCNIQNSEIKWGQFANTVNETLVAYNSELGNSEDKQLGSYFVNKDELTADKFPEKVLKYLWDDAFKMDHDIIFNTGIKSIGDIVVEYNKPGDPLKKILKKEIYDKMKEKVKDEPEATGETDEENQ